MKDNIEPIRLLELAAAAIGCEFTYITDPWLRRPNGIGGYWNPLEDDAEALRLAVELGISIIFGVGETDGFLTVSTGVDANREEWVFPVGADEPKIVRYAIVHAAASVGADALGVQV